MTAQLLVLGLSQWHLYQIWPLWDTRQVTHHLFNQLRQLLGLPMVVLVPGLHGLEGSSPQLRRQLQADGPQVQGSQQRRAPTSSSNSSNTGALLDALRGVLALLCHVSTCSSAAYAARLWGPPSVAGGRLAAVLQLADRKELLLADHGMQQLVMQLLNSCLAVGSVQCALFRTGRDNVHCHSSTSSSSIDGGGQGPGITSCVAVTTDTSDKQQLLMQCQLTSMCHAVLSRCVEGVGVAPLIPCTAARGKVLG
jgi:hypothetical protein